LPFFSTNYLRGFLVLEMSKRAELSEGKRPRHEEQ
jgi:hypothetical protein